MSSISSIYGVKGLKAVNRQALNGLSFTPKTKAEKKLLAEKKRKRMKAEMREIKKSNRQSFKRVREFEGVARPSVDVDVAQADKEQASASNRQFALSVAEEMKKRDRPMGGAL